MIAEFSIIKDEIIKNLAPLNPNKILLFGSYAKGNANNDSDIDLFVIKDDIDDKDIREYRFLFEKNLLDLQKKYLIGIDLFLDKSSRIEKRIKEYKDQFYIDIFNSGKVIYAK